MRRLLVVEDDPSIRLGLEAALRGEGYEVDTCPDGRQALPLVRDRRPDLVVLDVMLPGRSGFDVCRDLRAAGFVQPVLFLTAKGQEIDKVLGLELGADDYVTKPFALRELLARVKALLRRREMDQAGESMPPPAEIRCGSAVVDPAAMRGVRAGTTFDLTARELRTLVLLHREAGRVVSRDRLLDEVWGPGYGGTNRTVDQVIVKLRQKLEADPSKPRHVLTVHGVGYRLEP